MLAVVLSLTALFHHFGKNVAVEYSVDKMLAGDDPERIAFQHFVDHFEFEEFFLVTFESKDIFTPQILSVIEHLSNEMQMIEVDKTGCTYDQIKSLDLKLSINKWLYARLPEFLHNVKQGLANRIKDQEIELAGINPPTVDRLRPVKKPINILNAPEVRISEDFLEIGPMAPGGKAPYTAGDIDTLRLKVMANPNIWNTIISEDEKTTSIILPVYTYDSTKMINENTSPEEATRIKKFADNFRRELAFYADRVIKNQEKIDKDAGILIEYHLAGGPIFASHYVDYVERDVLIFYPLTLFVIASFLFLFFKNLRGIVLPLLIVTISVIWTFGIIGLSGANISLVSTILYPLILVIGFAVVLHILNRYNEEVSLYLKNENTAIFKACNHKNQKGLKSRVREEKLAAIENTIKHKLAPCFWTSATTSVGFGSLGVSQIVPVAQTGLFAAAGVMATFLVALILTPIFLSIMPIAKKAVKTPYEKTFLALALGRLSSLNYKFKHPILIVSIIAIGVSAFFMTRIIAETNLREYFKKDSPIRIAHTFLEDKLSGINSVEFAIDTKEPGRLKDPEALEAIVNFQEYLLKNPKINKTISLADTVRQLNQAINEGDIAHYEIPDSRPAVAQLLLLYEQGGTLENIVDSKYSFTYVTARFDNMGSRQIRDMVDQIMIEADTIFSRHDIKVYPIGLAWLGVTLEKYIIEGQIKSFALAMLLISVFMFFLLRSFGLGLAAIVPNLFPIIITFGFMGLSGIPINLATCMVPSIAIGIAVDDTIHFLLRYKQEMQNSKNDGEACRRVITTTGQAMVLTSIVLFAGFSVLLLSNFYPNVFFGELTALTMATALIGDLVVLPALLISFRISPIAKRAL